MSAQLPNEEVMRMMAKMAVIKATTSCAGFARDFAKSLPDDVSGKMALEAFARAIESNNFDFLPDAGRA